MRLYDLLIARLCFAVLRTALQCSAVPCIRIIHELLDGLLKQVSSVFLVGGWDKSCYLMMVQSISVYFTSTHRAYQSALLSMLAMLTMPARSYGSSCSTS